MDLGFKGKTALVTGAGSQVGFGRETALLLAAEGIEAVAVTARKVDEIEKTAQSVRDLGVKAVAIPADITDHAAVQGMVARAAEELGRIDILCNVAGGILHKDGVPLDEQDHTIWLRQFDLSLCGTMNVTQAVLPIMRAQKYGAIVNIGSGSTHAYSLGVSAYAMSKYALDCFTRQLAYAEAKAGIRVNCVAPGPAATGFAGLLQDDPNLSPEEQEAMRQAMLGVFPLGRLGTADDIAKATVFLASDVTSYVTGQVFHVSGGSVM